MALCVVIHEKALLETFISLKFAALKGNQYGKGRRFIWVVAKASVERNRALLWRERRDRAYVSVLSGILTGFNLLIVHGTAKEKKSSKICILKSKVCIPLKELVYF